MPAAPTKRQIERELRSSYAELCYYYPQYKLEDLTGDDGLVMGDINLLLNFARYQSHQDKLDMLYVVASASGKKTFKALEKKLQKILKSYKARI